MAHPTGLKSKITIVVSILVILLMSIVAFVMFTYFEKQLKASIAQSQFVTVTAMANEIDKKLTVAHNQIIATAQNIPATAFSSPDRAQIFLDNLTGLLKIFDNHIFLFTPDGRILAESPFTTNRRGLDLSYRPYYKSTVTTMAPVISDPYTSSQVKNHPAVMMTAPIFDANGTLIGILSGSLDLLGENLLKDLSRITIGRTGYLYLTTQESRMRIMHPKSDLIMKPIMPGANPLFDKAVAGFEGTGDTVNTWGDHMLTSFKHLKVNNWILGANYPISEAHEIIFELQKKFFAAAASGIFFVLFIVYYLIKRLTYPLVFFTRHIETLNEKTGEEKLLDITSRDEIGTLSTAFNRMLIELDQQKEILQKSEEEYRTIYNSANDAIIIHDLDSGIILDVNQKMCEMYGFSQEEARKIDIGVLSEGIAPYTLQGAMEWVSKASQGEPQLFEWRAKSKSGQLFWVEVKIRRAEIGGVGRILATVSDISGRKLAEESIRIQAAELEKLNQELEQRVHDRTAELSDRNAEVEKAYDDLKIVQSQLLQQDKMASVGQLAAGVAHEINNPMGFIISNLSSLGKYVEKLTAYLDADEKVLAGCDSATREKAAQERQKYKIAHICKDMPDLISESSEGAQRVRQIVQDLKNFSRVDGTEFASANINDGLDSTLSIAWNELKYKTSVAKEYGDLPNVWCNMGQLNQVFLNILVNSAHAIEDHGEIMIKTWEDNGKVLIAISDTGSGIKPENVKRIFDPFFTTKEVGKGTGLGLAIAYDIITNKHGGTIEVQSEVGVGTTFTITLPVKREL